MATINAIVENIATDSGEFEFDTNLETPEAVAATGSASESDFMNYFSYWGLDEVAPCNCGCAGSQIETDYWSGSMVPNSANFSFYYTQSSAYSEASISCYRNGTSEGRGASCGGGCWGSDNGTYDDSSGTVDVSGSSGDNGCSFTKSGSGYSAVCSQTETHTEEWGAGPATVNTTTTLSANVQPYGSSTGIRRAAALPKSYSLSQNYPNPFNPSTVISYQLPVKTFVVLKVYDVLGRDVRTLVNQSESAGYYTVTFNASSLPSGVYFYRIIAAGNDGRRFISTKKLVLMK
jgi:hypothetical protein